MNPLEITQVKVVNRIYEEAGTACDHPKRVVELWKKCVETESWFDPEKECGCVFNLNTKLRVKNWQMVAVGTINEMSITPREVLRSAVASLAHSIIFLHNHPTGNPSPSAPDLDFTRRLRDGGKTLNINVQDHIIVGDGQNGNQPYYSFREAGYL